MLGARSRDIVRLLAWQFSKPVIIANLIAWPIAWWVMRDWLNSSTPDRPRADALLLAGFLALAIAIGTIAGHALKWRGKSDPRAEIRMTAQLASSLVWAAALLGAAAMICLPG